jgi:hypothetical protein
MKSPDKTTTSIMKKIDLNATGLLFKNMTPSGVHRIIDVLFAISLIVP